MIVLHAGSIRAVIFDFNGVLVDDEHVHFELFREVLAQEGIVLTELDYHGRYLGLDDRGCFEAALEDSGRSPSAAELDELIARKARRYAEVAETGLRFFPGASECLAELAKRWPLAINSGALRPEIEFALRLLSRRDRIAAIVSAEDTTRCKPDPQGYLLALDALRASVPDLDAAQCLVIEDSLAGIESAKGAGMKAVGVAHTYTQPELVQAGADAVVTVLADFNPQWINQTFSQPNT